MTSNPPCSNPPCSDAEPFRYCPIKGCTWMEAQPERHGKTVHRLTTVELTRLAIGTETAVVFESDLNALEQSLTQERQQREAAEAERDNWRRMANAADEERVETYGRWRRERDALRAQLDAAREALTVAKAHVDELEDAWQRGILREGDKMGGTRSNRNVEVRVALAKALSEPQQTA